MLRKAEVSFCPLSFPSPHSGILFLSDRKYLINDMWDPLGFRPLIRGFFFYGSTGGTMKNDGKVSVPSFGDSFFINRTTVRSLK